MERDIWSMYVVNSKSDCMKNRGNLDFKICLMRAVRTVDTGWVCFGKDLCAIFQLHFFF